MGFAAGVNAGTSFMSKLQENERLNRAEGRLEEEYDYKKRERDAVDKAVANVPDFPGGLNTTSPVTAVPTVNAPPTSVAATGGTGVPPEAPVGQQLRVAAAQAVPEKAPALGLQGPGAAPDPGLQGAPAAPAAPTGGLQGPQSPAAAAAAPAAKEMSHDMKVAQAMFGVAKAKKDVKGMNDALNQYHTVARKEIVNDSAKMSDDDAYNYLHTNVNKVGSLPMSIVKEGKGGYRVTAWSDDGGKGASALLSSADVKKLVAADKMMKSGYGGEGLDLAGSVNKDLNAVIKDYNTATDKMVGTGNTATHYANTEAETGRHNRASEANAAANTAINRDRVNSAKNADKLAGMDIVASNKEGYVLMNKKGEREFVKYPEGVTQADFVKKYQPQGDTAPKINSDGSATYQGQLYERDPKTNKWVPAEGFGPSALEKRWDAKYGTGATPAAPGGAAPPAGGLNTGSPTQQPVEGRPLYYADSRELSRIATKPRGISTAEANEAAAELASRKGEQRIQGLN